MLLPCLELSLSQVHIRLAWLLLPDPFCLAALLQIGKIILDKLLDTEKYSVRGLVHSEQVKLSALLQAYNSGKYLPSAFCGTAI